MDIDKLVNLITQQVRERLEVIESRKKVLFMGCREEDCGEKLRSSLEACGLCLYEAEASIDGQELYDYDYVVISRSRLGEIMKKQGSNEVCSIEGVTNETGLAKQVKLEKKVVTEKDIQKLAREGYTQICLEKKAVITPLALDTAKVSGIRLIKE
ncbi:MAG: hypothetical protein ACM3ZR_05310 [Pseudomonadota bacterium]